MKVRKRDGRLEDFQEEKIIEAIWKSVQDIGGKDRKEAENIGKLVAETVKEKFSGKIPSVEDIQDIVEKVLIEKGHAKTAKNYILHREKRKSLRDTKEFLVDSVKLIEDYIGKEDWRVYENANAVYSLPGLLWYSSGTIMSFYALNNIYPKEISQAHISGHMHIHNLSMALAGYCAGWSLRQLLHEGFNGIPGKIECHPPKHLRSAIGQMINFIGTLQNEWAGAQAFNSFDTYLAPFVRQDKLSYKEVKQCIQEYVYNMNIASRWGGQTPFTNITLDLQVPEDLKEQKVSIGGKILESTYSNYEKEMQLINKALIEVLVEGDAKARVFTFPIPTYNLTKNFDWNSEISDLLFEMTAKYGLPYFQNFINSELNPSDIRAMCLHGDENLILRDKGVIKRVKIKELVNNYFKGEGEWSDFNTNTEALSLNPQNYKVEWVRIKNLLRTKGKTLVTLKTRDGKEIKVSDNHPVAVYTKEGIKLKSAIDVDESDLLLTTKNAEESLNKEYQKIDEFILDEDFAYFLGLFLAEGNYLYENRQGYKNFGLPKGMQFTFNLKEEKYVNFIKEYVHKKFNKEITTKKDSRYSAIYCYFYDTQLLNKVSKYLNKKGKLNNIFFNSPKSVISSFLKGFFAGDGYEKGNEIHINDAELSEDLCLLFSLIGIPVTFRKKEHSQIIRIQHIHGRGTKEGIIKNDILYNRVPGFVVQTGKDKPFYNYSCLVSQSAIKKHNASTEESNKIINGCFAIVRLSEKKIEFFDEPIDFYDIELEKNHFFIHSLGSITHNCCRLQLNLKELQKNVTGGRFSSGESTGSVGVVTINLSRLAYESKDEEEFLEKLERYMYLAKESLEIKRKIVERNIQRNLLPFTKRYLGTLKRHFSTIGLIGMHEACLNLLGEGIETKEGQELGIQVLKFMRKKLLDYQEETGNIYNLEATPGEGASYRLALKDKKEYPKIITAGKKEPYYTNSTMLPVSYTSEVFSALKHQEPLQKLYTAGTVFHTFLGEAIDKDSCKLLVKKIATSFSLPYFTITPTFSICEEHGYLKDEQKLCPKCKKPTEVYSRVVGYFRPVEDWNKGKQEEFSERRVYAPV